MKKLEDDNIIIFLCVKNIVPQKDKDGKNKKRNNDEISDRTEDQIDRLPQHAQEIFKEAYKNSLDQYSDPKKRRGGKKESQEEVAHKVAWSAVKRKYIKDGDKWEKNNILIRDFFISSNFINIPILNINNDIDWLIEF